MLNWETIYKEDLLNDFLEDSGMITYLNWENDKVIDYLWKKYWYNSNWDKAYRDFIEENFYYYLDDENAEFDENILKKWIEDIKEFETNDYIDWLIDVYDEDLIQSYKYFQEWTDTYEIDENNIEIMTRAQWEWYSILFNDIKYNFIKFLEWELY